MPHAAAQYIICNINTDSVFLRKAPIEEYENVTKTLSKEIGLPISVEQFYKFLVLLPLEASERMEALKHYFGMTQSGKIIARGIEIRRHLYLSSLFFADKAF